MTDRGVKAAGIIDTVLDALAHAGTVALYDGTPPSPNEAAVREASCPKPPRPSPPGPVYPQRRFDILDAAGAEILARLYSGFFSTGRRCTASSRLIVTEDIHDRFIAAMAEKMKALKVDDARKKGHRHRADGRR